MMNFVIAGLEESANAVSTISSTFADLDLSVISDTLLEITPIALGVVIPVIAVRKAISFLTGAVHGA